MDIRITRAQGEKTAPEEKLARETARSRKTQGEVNRLQEQLRMLEAQLAMKQET